MDSRGGNNDCNQCPYKPSKEKVDEVEANWHRNSISLKECYNGESNHQSSNAWYHSQQNEKSHEAWAANGPLILLQQGGIVHTGPHAIKLYYSQLEALNLYGSVGNTAAVIIPALLYCWACDLLGHIWQRPLQHVYSFANFGLGLFYITI